MTLPPARLAEIAVYFLLGTVPFTLLAVYPFRRQFRFSRGVTAFLLVLLTVLQAGLRTVAVVCPDGWGDEVRAWCTGLGTLLYALCAFLLIHAHFGKLLFTLLMLSNIAALAVIDGKCMEGLMFGEEMARQSCRWTVSVAMVLVLLALLPPRTVFSPVLCACGGAAGGAQLLTLSVADTGHILPVVVLLFLRQRPFGAGHCAGSPLGGIDPVGKSGRIPHLSYGDPAGG